MTLASLEADFADAKQVAAYVGGLLEALGGKTSTAASTPAASTAASATGIALSVDALPELTAGFNTLTSVAKMFTQWDAENNTPAMVNASVSQKLQAFKDRINTDLATGNEADLEKLEAE